MYVVTFYSYKGGVGRTMALVNTAAELAARGQRVLLIDFDLEAPGLSTYDELARSDAQQGMVEYVHEFLATNKAPQAQNFIHRCELTSGTQSHPIWVMPAGIRDTSYSSRLSTIDWRDLYDNRSGFLLFEDLKQQLAKDAREFDYVMIDSRTGHTDVGGICTRQLADAVIMMFYPNKQNVLGLKTIADDIRAFPSRTHKERVSLLFCASDVPDLDDEFGVLQSMLDFSQAHLHYEDKVVINHYTSLSLIEQRIFTKDRPRTKLADQYRTLTNQITRFNLEDPAGAMFQIGSLKRTLSKRGWHRRVQLSTEDTGISEALLRLEKIGRLHTGNPEISWELAAIYNDLGNIQAELEALNSVIELDPGHQGARLKRALNLLAQAKQPQAANDLQMVLASPDTTVTELSSAVQALKSIDPNWAQSLQKSPALTKVSPGNFGIIADALMSDDVGTEVAYDIVHNLLAEHPSWSESEKSFDNDFVLVLIGTGHFREALDALSIDLETALSTRSIEAVFNYAMASWGTRGSPDKQLFKWILEIHLDDPDRADANYLQCMSLSSAVIGDISDAYHFLDTAKQTIGPNRVFSCWNYRYVGRETMMRHLEDMRTSFANNEVTPTFLEKQPRLRPTH